MPIHVKRLGEQEIENDPFCSCCGSEVIVSVEMEENRDLCFLCRQCAGSLLDEITTALRKGQTMLFSEPPVLNTVEEIENYPVYGNHYQDHPLWSAVDKIIMDETKPLELRLAASKKVDQIVGQKWEGPPDPIERIKFHAEALRKSYGG